MRYLILLLFFLLKMNLLAQPGFNQSYDMGGLAAGFCSMELSGDTVIIYGTGYEAGESAFGMLFARLDTFGNVIDYKIYNDSLGDDFTLMYPNSFIKRPNNSGYAGVGQVFYRQNGYLALFDQEGNVANYVEYKDSVSLTDFYKQVIELEDGFLIAGEKQNPVTYKTEIFVIKTDLQGNIIWEKKYPALNRATYLGQVQKVNSNEYLICGNTIKTNVLLSQQRYTSKIFSIDSLGSIKWQWESQPSLEELGASGLNKMSDGNWIYRSARGQYDAIDNTIYAKPTIVIRDSAFNLISMDTFGISGSNTQGFSNLIPLMSKGWLAIGSVPVKYETPPDESYNALSGWFIRFDSTATPVWSRVDTAFWSTQTGSTNHLYDAVELPGGSIIACGYSRTYEPAGKDWGWLIKINADGCVDTLSCAVLSARPELAPPDLVKIYPNPTSAVVTIESPETARWDKIEVIGMSGQVVFSLEHSSENRVDLSGLPDGFYFIRLTQSNRSVTKKVVKKRG